MLGVASAVGAPEHYKKSCKVPEVCECVVDVRGSEIGERHAASYRCASIAVHLGEKLLSVRTGRFRSEDAVIVKCERHPSAGTPIVTRPLEAAELACA